MFFGIVTTIVRNEANGAACSLVVPLFDMVQAANCGPLLTVGRLGQSKLAHHLITCHGCLSQEQCMSACTLPFLLPLALRMIVSTLTLRAD
jgi:hypothetical protein